MRTQLDKVRKFLCTTPPLAPAANTPAPPLPTQSDWVYLTIVSPSDPVRLARHTLDDPLPTQSDWVYLTIVAPPGCIGHAPLCHRSPERACRSRSRQAPTRPDDPVDMARRGWGSLDRASPSYNFRASCCSSPRVAWGFLRRRCLWREPPHTPFRANPNMQTLVLRGPAAKRDHPSIRASGFCAGD